MRYVKRKKLKKSVIVVFLLLLLGIGGMVGMQYVKHSSKTPSTKSEKVDYVAMILEHQNDLSFDADFLRWVDQQYPDALQKIDLALQEERYQRALWHEVTGSSYFVLQDLYQDNYQNRTDVQVIGKAQEEVEIGYAGDVSLADNWDIMPYYKSRGGITGILSEDLLSYMREQDFLIVNSEFPFSDRGSAMPGKQYTFRAATKNVDIYHEMGVDLVTLANNHVYDFGRDAFYDTLSTLKGASIPYIGAGVNIEEAMQPYYLIVNGYKIAFLNATRAEKYILTPEATETEGGVFRCYDPTAFANKISQTKQQSDYVVALVHWGTENTHNLENVQKETGRLYIDSGADMVIGTHAHVLQGVEFYNGKLIAYNLGNFIFNDYTIDTGIITWKLKNDGSSTFYFLPALQKDCYTKVVTDEEKTELLSDMTSWSINTTFLEDGEIVANQ